MMTWSARLAQRELEVALKRILLLAARSEGEQMRAIAEIARKALDSP